MTSVADQHPQQNDASQAEPPTKKRRGGRRSSNPEVSAEERKRLRILKNRESAMRSLAKKAEYSAKLETLEKDAIAHHKSSHDSLEQLIATAITLKSSLNKIPEDISSLVAKADNCIDKATTALLQDRDPPPTADKPMASSESVSHTPKSETTPAPGSPSTDAPAVPIPTSTVAPISPAPAIVAISAASASAAKGTTAAVSPAVVVPTEAPGAAVSASAVDTAEAPEDSDSK